MTSERGLGQILGRRRGSDSPGSLGIASRQRRVGLADCLLERRRQRRGRDPAPDLGARVGERADVVDIERREPRGDARTELVVREEFAKRERGGREAARDANSRTRRARRSSRPAMRSCRRRPRRRSLRSASNGMTLGLSLMRVLSSHSRVAMRKTAGKAAILQSAPVFPRKRRTRKTRTRRGGSRTSNVRAASATRAEKSEGVGAFVAAAGGNLERLGRLRRFADARFVEGQAARHPPDCAPSRPGGASGTDPDELPSDS